MINNDALLQKGIDLAKEGNFEQASMILAQVVKANPNSEKGWLWLGRCRTALEEKRYCFKMALSVNPQSEDAQYELNNLGTWEKPTVLSSEGAVQSQSVSPAPASIEDITGQPKNKKTWVRRTIYLLAGIMVGIYLGWYLASVLAPSGFFDKIDNTITLLTIHVPEFNASPAATAPVESTPTISVTESYDKRLEKAWPLISQADILTTSQRYADTIPIWNQALEIVPEYVDGYYKRGAAYFYLTQSQRAKSEYDSYLQLAIQDFDKAISLKPNVGDYYIMRGRAYHSLAYQQSLRIDLQNLEHVALENYLYGKELPHDEAWKNLETNLYSTMIRAGNCEEVIPKVTEMLNSTQDPSPGLHEILSNAYYCVGDLEKALEHKNEVMKLDPSSVCLCERATILYGLGRFDEAMADIEKSLSEQPYYGGDRYYFRALIYADRGNTEQAQKDLDFGITQTWVRGGMLSYVQGKIALAQNKKEEALYYYEEAEATYFDEGPMLEKIRQDLMSLGGTPNDASRTKFSLTPIPMISTPTPQAIITPTSTANP